MHGFLKRPANLSDDSDAVSSNSRQKNCTSEYPESLVQGEEHGQFPMPNKGEVYSLTPRRCVDFGLAKTRMTPYPNVWGAPPFGSCFCFSTTGNAYLTVDMGSRVSITKERQDLARNG